MNRCHTIPACHGRTDGQTDRQTDGITILISISRVSVLTRDKYKKWRQTDVSKQIAAGSRFKELKVNNVQLKYSEH